MELDREYAGPICFWGFVGALPFAILNFLLLLPFQQYDNLLLANGSTVDEAWLRTRYTYLAMALVYLESPFALQAVTFFLGQAVFVEKPDRQEVIKHFRKNFGRTVWILGCVRFGFAGILVVLLIPHDSGFEPFLELVVLGIVVLGISLLVRSIRPFAPEILLLEQCPLRQKEKDRPSYSKRSYWLHSPISSDLLGVSIMCILLSGFGWFTLEYSERFAVGLLFGVWDSGWWTDFLFLPFNFWLLALIQTVFRFLLYLDSRIRLEGWELELRLKAEVDRMEAAT
jgi:hypothetical protein